MMRRALLFVTLLLILGSSVGAVAGQTLPWRDGHMPERDVTTITVGEHELEVILAITPAEQSLGLGYRNGLDEGRGMLFPYAEAAQRSFWMQGMRFCIDIVWINSGTIIGAHQNVCPDPEGISDADRPRYESGQDVTHVLEVPAGWVEEHGYSAGTNVEIPDLPLGEAS